ncbi:DUF721 domain-containing protein [Oscillatoria sp. FACHB-1407]|uniref:DUF721 domain-containing protein n=1 Tax=Oscillatoria sp. FACHB-1407 TaxID=2692847 RepID=UPI001687AFFD|nr:DUF721 domain-containing protein [Oscillatoria sp. FACHB-1407]MBD2461325.1 DUF721 domain-containing protein [Oscillatoria sp. FACHB-1407]
MSFKSLHQLFSSFDNQDAWQAQQQFQKLLGCWFQVVGPVVAAHTRPIKIQRQVLQVATSSPAWAQNLVFERHRILEKLNAQLGSQLTDIRFSTAQWYSDAPKQDKPDSATVTWQEHPSRIETDLNTLKPGLSETSSDPVEVFQHWSERMRSRLQHLPLCPQCQCPTPTGELKRWSVCALCATKQWQPKDS